MKKLYSFIFLFLFTFASALAQESKFTTNFYGFARSDFFYDSRASVASVNEIFYLYPLEQSYDALGYDLNDTSSSGFFSFITRMGVDVVRSKVANATASAKIEIDFGGYGNYNTLLRIRHAYINLKWDNGHTMLIGQSWHPLFGEVMPTMINISTGAPYQPFSRSPQLRYQYQTGGVKFTAAALTQLQYTTSGVNGNSNEYMLNANMPELYFGVDVYSGNFQFGGGVDISTIAPRTEATVDGLTYKVDERLVSTSGDIHFLYQTKTFKAAIKSIYASALDHTTMLGGYGVTSVSGDNYEQTYTPIHSSSSWLNIVYGTTWKPSLFVGYVKNLGTSEALYSASTNYGRGLDIDQLLGVNLGVTYNKPSWSAGVEFSTSTAWYGDLDITNGRVYNTNDVTNCRVVAMMSYIF